MYKTWPVHAAFLSLLRQLQFQPTCFSITSETATVPTHMLFYHFWDSYSSNPHAFLSLLRQLQFQLTCFPITSETATVPTHMHSYHFWDSYSSNPHAFLALLRQLQFQPTCFPSTSETATVPTHMLFQTLPFVFGSLRGELPSSVSEPTRGERWDRLCRRFVVLGYSPCRPVWHRLLTFSQGLHLQAHTEAQQTEKHRMKCVKDRSILMGTQARCMQCWIKAAFRATILYSQNIVILWRKVLLAFCIIRYLVHKMVCYMSSQQTTIM